MYEDFYRLTGKPFQLSPDPAFYFAGGAQQRVCLSEVWCLPGRGISRDHGRHRHRKDHAGACTAR